jgi:hypothetical protein
MESRWLAVVSLIVLFDISLPFPVFPATLKAESTSHQSHKRAVTKTVLTKKVATKTSTRKTVTTKKVAKRTATKTVARKTSAAAVGFYSAALSNRINASFKTGRAANYSPTDLLRAKVFAYYPLRGGVRQRSEGIQNLILHSTETGRPADGRTIVRSWNNIGRSHPGAQYLVDRDGTIIQTVDPYYATIHVNSRTALRGVNNDNSIGIEIVRSGKQKYTQKQLDSLVALVDYVKNRYNISSIYGHGEIQPSDRTDPVAFDWSRFAKNLAMIQRGKLDTQTAYRQATGRSDG